MSATHWDGCRASVLRRADDLIDAIKTGRMNASAFEGLIRSHLAASAFYPEWREKLLDLALDRFSARRTP